MSAPHLKQEPGQQAVTPATIPESVAWENPNIGSTADIAAVIAGLKSLLEKANQPRK